MLKQGLIMILLLVAFSPSYAQASDEAVHTELRQLLSGIETAVNNRDYEKLAPYFHDNLRVTTVNQNTISSPEGIEAYFEEWFGDGGYLRSLKMDLTADDLTEFYNNNTMGIVRGKGVEQYQLTDGRDLDLQTRWTATVIKDSDGQWRILALHIGTNFYDNAIYHEMRSFLIKMGSVGVIIALLLGLIAGFYIRARRA